MASHQILLKWQLSLARVAWVFPPGAGTAKMIATVLALDELEIVITTTGSQVRMIDRTKTGEIRAGIALVASLLPGVGGLPLAIPGFQKVVLQHLVLEKLFRAEL
jgi:hypothetical protein